MSIETLSRPKASRQWWWSHRCRYNKGLLIAGLIAFMIYNILGEIIISKYEEFEETIFEMAFQGGAYLMMMVVANIIYSLGWIIDMTCNPANSLRFRERLFALGYWFSFAFPILLILSVMVRFLIWGK